MNAELPQMSGVAATRMIRATRPDAVIIVLSFVDEAQTVREALAAGAFAVMSKDRSFADVWDAMRIACGRPVDGRVAVPNTTGYGDHRAILSSRKIQIVQLIADGRTPSQVARHLNLSLKTINNHLTAVYRQLNTQNITQTLMHCVRTGLIAID